MTIQTYYPQQQPVRTADVDSWVPVLSAVGDLAVKLAGTDFVPEAMRGKPAAVAAAILTGREMGIGPMQALQSIHIIKGKPGQAAQLMRALVLAAGHSIRTVEATDSRCVIEGKRRGEDEWEQVTFTADQARRAKIDLGAYPSDKLFARASSRLCRRKFADCLAGMAYSIEELQDGDGDDTPRPVAVLPAIEAPKRTAKRAAPKTEPSLAPTPAPAVTVATKAQAKAAETDTVPPPPLPGEEDDDLQAGDDDAQPPPEPADPQAPVTRAQLTKMHAAFNAVGIKDRDERLHITGSLISTPITTATELTKADATTLIDLLEQAEGTGNPREYLEALAAIPGRVVDTRRPGTDSIDDPLFDEATQ